MATAEQRSFTTTPEGEAFGEAMRRLLNGGSQGELGAAIAKHEGRDTAYSQSQVSAWLAGKEPNPRQAIAIERAFNCPPGALTRLLGYMPLDAKSTRTVRDAIEADHRLDARGRRLLLLLYREVIK